MIKYLMSIFLFLCLFVNVSFANLADYQNQLSGVLSKLEVKSFKGFNSSESLAFLFIDNGGNSVYINPALGGGLNYQRVNATGSVGYFGNINDISAQTIRVSQLQSSGYYQTFGQKILVNNKFKREIGDTVFFLEKSNSYFNFKFCGEEIFDYYNEGSQIFAGVGGGEICVNIYQFGRIVDFYISRLNNSSLYYYNIIIRNKDGIIIHHTFSWDGNINNNLLIPNLTFGDKIRYGGQIVNDNFNYYRYNLNRGGIFSNEINNPGYPYYQIFPSSFQNQFSNFFASSLYDSQGNITSSRGIFGNYILDKVLPSYSGMINLPVSFFQQKKTFGQGIFHFSTNELLFNSQYLIGTGGNFYIKSDYFTGQLSGNFGTFPYIFVTGNNIINSQNTNQFSGEILDFMLIYEHGIVGGATEELYFAKYENRLCLFSKLRNNNIFNGNIIHRFINNGGGLNYADNMGCISNNNIFFDRFPNKMRDLTVTGVPSMPQIPGSGTPQTPQISGEIQIDLGGGAGSNRGGTDGTDPLRGGSVDPNFFEPGTIDPNKYNQSTKDAISAANRIIGDPIMCLIPQIDFLNASSERWFCQGKDGANVNINDYCNITFGTDSPQSYVCQKCQYGLSTDEISYLNGFSEMGLGLQRGEFFIGNFLSPLANTNLLFYRLEDIQQMTVYSKPEGCEANTGFRSNFFGEYNITCFLTKIENNFIYLSRSVTNFLGTIFQFSRYEKGSNYSLCPSEFGREMIDKTYNQLFLIIDIIISSFTALMIIGYLVTNKEKIVKFE